MDKGPFTNDVIILGGGGGQEKMTYNDIGGGGGVDHNESLLKLTDAPQALKIFSQNYPSSDHRTHQKL